LLRDLLDASAALWNEVTYERLMRYDDEDGLEDEGVWDAPTGQLEGRYKSILGASTAQQVIRTNSEAWRSFFDLKEKYHDDTNSSITEHPEPPGFRGNSEDGRELKTVIRNTSYTVEWGDRSRLEILAGTELKDRYDHTGRLRLEIVGKPNWPDYETQGRLNLWYDDVAGTFRASQHVTVSDDARATPLASEEAALTSAPTTSSPAPHRPGSSISTKAASCSNGSGRRPGTSPSSNRSSRTAGTAAGASGGCSAGGPAAATTLKKRCAAIWLSDYTRLAWRRSTSET
jgi:hypothetical protein